MLKPVEFWDTPDTSVSPDDQKMLTSYFYNSLQKNLQQHFILVDQPGPGVITVGGCDYQRGVGHARFAFGFPGRSTGSHIELRAIPRDRACGLRRLRRGGLQGHGFDQRHLCWRSRSTNASVAWRWPMQRKYKWGDAEAAMDYRVQVSPSVRSSSARVLRRPPLRHSASN